MVLLSTLRRLSDSTAAAALARLAAGAVALAATGVHAQSVTVGLAAEVTSVDPHYHVYTPNNNVADHLFSHLVERNDLLRLVPGLALSWRPLDDTTWEFKLRPGVTFHDGSPFTAEDVAFTLERAPAVKDSPGGFVFVTRTIASAKVVDPLTIVLKTRAPNPLLPNELAALAIVSKKAAAGASTADFNSGKAAIGTGPYKLVRFTRGDRVELVRNEQYWGKKPEVQHLTLKLISNDAARVASLLSNDSQVIEAVPVGDLKRLVSNADLAVVQRASIRVIFITLDVARDVSPFVTDKDGKPLPSNPLKNVKVRLALSKAIDRELLRTRVMEGASRPTLQLVLPGMPGHSEHLKVEPADVEGARKLLAEAGYPNGFGLTLHGPNNRYVQDDQLLQAVAQMWSRVGVSTKVEAQPAAVFFPKNNRKEYSASLSGWASETGDASSPLRAFIATRNAEKSLGTFNTSGYSNAKVDALIEKAGSTLDDAERDKLLQQAVELAMSEHAVIPLHNQMNIWAARKGLRYGGRADERTYAFNFGLQGP